LSFTRSPIARAAPALAAAIMALAIYVVSLRGVYVYDDRSVIQLDPRLHPPIQWTKLWTQAYANDAPDNLYRPLVTTSYAIQWWLHGDKPWAFHLINWLLHAAAAAMVAELARRSAGTVPAYIAGIFFAVHPVHVEAVANIVGRAELMCAIGVLGALILFAHRPLTPARSIAIFACAVLAILSKEQGVMLPMMLGAYWWFVWRNASPNDGPEIVRRFASDLAPLRLGYQSLGLRNPIDVERNSLRWLTIALTWATAGYLLARNHFLKMSWDRSFLDWSMQPMIQSYGLDRALMPLVLMGHYAQLLVFPIHLSPDYGGGVIGSVVHFDDPYLWAGIATVIIWIACTIFCVHQRRGFAAFCLLSFAIMYGLIGNIFMLIGTNMAERLMYLPSVFFLMWVALGLATLRPMPRVVIVTTLVVLASIRTVTYAARWNNRFDFYLQAQAEQPRSVQLILLVAEEYQEHGDLKSADTVLARGLEQFPRSWKIWAQRSSVAMDDGRLDDAEKYLKRGIDIRVAQEELALRGRLSELEAKPKAPRTK
jgi:protein O-mannosyl-transferase